MVRLKDIAEKAGLSVMTISKALRDAPDISASTKVRVKLLAEQMGYVPDSIAQGLRNRTSKLFGLVIPSMTNPLFARMVGAIEERLCPHCSTAPAAASSGRTSVSDCWSA